MDRSGARRAAADHLVGAGDAVVVLAGALFSLANPYATAFEALAVLPVGARGALADGQWFTPPWTE